jgi:ASC-1-like (ASCH) protein
MPKRPVRFFNTTGPCNPDDHYMLPPADRLQGAQLHRYIKDNLYWMLHAPRQTGKTTFLQSWMREINAGSNAVSCYVSVERCQGIGESERAMPAIGDAVREAAAREGLPVPETTSATSSSANSLLSSLLGNWAAKIAPKPLVVLFDEVDVLEGETLISFLRQLRGGFASRGIGKFPTSIALVGMRDLKDYLTAAKNGKSVNPGSPFNIKEDSAVIGNFFKEDIAHLFAQRTEETGQQITPEALNYIWEQSRGQPWIVNSLFKRATLQILDADSNETVTLEYINQAREQMILARETHLDVLVWRIKDPQIRKIMETLLSGRIDTELGENEAFRQCLDLGLVAYDDGEITIANPIYREVLARQISYGAQIMMPKPMFRWQKPDGSLDMDLLLREFQKFWRRHSDIWALQSGYTEAFPHLLLMAFLQRITNGEGRIEREYAAGRGRMDLLIEYAGKTFILEIKLIRDYDSPELVQEEGLEQILSYRDKFDKLIPCYLLIFDRRSEGKKLPWEQRIQWKIEGEVTVVGC